MGGGAHLLRRSISRSIGPLKKKIDLVALSAWQSSRAPFSRYRYYSPSSLGLDFSGLVSDVRSAPPGSIFLFHACAHNPTGVDPTPEQWESIAGECKQAGHKVVFDMAYQESLDSKGSP